MRWDVARKPKKAPQKAVLDWSNQKLVPVVDSALEMGR